MAFSKLMAYVILRNRQVFQDPRPFFDMLSLSEFKQNTLLNIQEGLGFIQGVHIENSESGNLIVDEKLKSVDTVVRNVEKLISIAKALGEMPTMSAEEILLCCPYRKCKSL